MYGSKIAKIATSVLIFASASASAEMATVATAADFEGMGTIDMTETFDIFPTENGPRTYDWLYGKRAAFKADSGYVAIQGHDSGRNLLTSFEGTGLSTLLVDAAFNKFDMFSFQAGAFKAAGPSTFVLETNTGNHYTVDANLGNPDSLNFYGFQFTGGEYISKLYTTGDVGITDVQLGTATVSPVPEPATFALMGAGLAVLGFARRRESKKV